MDKKNHLPDVNKAGKSFQPSGIVNKTEDEFVNQNIGKHWPDKPKEVREKLLREVHKECLAIEKSTPAEGEAPPEDKKGTGNKPPRGGNNKK